MICFHLSGIDEIAAASEHDVMPCKPVMINSADQFLRATGQLCLIRRDQSPDISTGASTEI